MQMLILLAAFWCFNPIALRKAKIVYNFGLSEYNKVKKLNGAVGLGFELIPFMGG